MLARSSIQVSALQALSRYWDSAWFRPWSLSSPEGSRSPGESAYHARAKAGRREAAAMRLLSSSQCSATLRNRMKGTAVTREAHQQLVRPWRKLTYPERKRAPMAIRLGVLFALSVLIACAMSACGHRPFATASSAPSPTLALKSPGLVAPCSRPVSVDADRRSRRDDDTHARPCRLQRAQRHVL